MRLLPIWVLILEVAFPLDDIFLNKIKENHSCAINFSVKEATSKLCYNRAVNSFGKKILSALNKVINYAIVAILLASLFIGLYAVWDTKIVHTQASSAHWTPYKPTRVEKLSYEELVEINPDVKAWITLYGTGIDYPVCYSKEQNYYLFRDAKGQRSIIGSIFFDSNCAPDFSH